MNVTFEFCGILERLAGATTLQLDLGQVGTVGEAIYELGRRVPGLSPTLERCACAIGDVLVPRSAALPSGSRLALLPPVAGG